MKHIIICVIFFLSLLTMGLKPFPKHLVFSTFEEEMVITETMLQVMTEAYGRIGITIELLRLPGERAIQTANNGKVDGELFRKKEGIEQAYPNLIKIPICIHKTELVVFTKNGRLTVKGWDDLFPYKVGFRRGLKAVEMNIVEGTQKAATNSTALSFKMLAEGRNDVVVSSRIDGVLTIRELGLENIYVLEPPLIIIESYHYLHVKNKNLVPILTDALQQMEREGIIQRIWERVEKRARW